jgi:hypothetical protein
MPRRSRQLWMLKCWILQKSAKYLSMIHYAISSSQILFSNVKCKLQKPIFIKHTVLRIRIRIRIHVFLASWTRIRIHWSRGRIRILPSIRKNGKKNLDFYCFVTSLGLQKELCRKTFFLILVFCGHLEGQVNDENRWIQIRIRFRGSISQRHGSAHPKMYGSAKLHTK